MFKSLPKGYKGDKGNIGLPGTRGMKGQSVSSIICINISIYFMILLYLLFCGVLCAQGCSGFGKFWKVKEIDSAIFQDLESLGSGAFSGFIQSGKSRELFCSLEKPGKVREFLFLLNICVTPTGS